MQAAVQTNDPVAKILAQATAEPTHMAMLNGHRVNFHQAHYDEVIAELVRDHGPGVPTIRPIMTPDLRRETTVKAVQSMIPDITTALKVGEYDAEGDKRSQRDRDAAILAGFSPRAPIYRQGSRATGMQRFRDKFEKLPMARYAATALITRVQNEQRRDVAFPAVDVRVNKEGLLALGRGKRLKFTRRGFSSMVNRLQMPAGASTYLPEISPDIRALNINHWVAEQYKELEVTRAKECYAAKKTFEPETLVFRTRNAAVDGGEDAVGADRECFGVVSDSYGEFDADKIAEALKLAVPEDARARVVYDGVRTKFDVVFFSNVPVEQAVAGEFFQAAVQIRTDDTGGGSIVVSAALHQNLCLNFIILDKAFGEVARIRHIGSTEKLAERFREAFAAALAKIGHFVQAWGYAQEENVTVRSLVAAKNMNAISAEDFANYTVRPVSEMLPGIFNGLIERELVPLPKRDRATTVRALMDMWAKDESFATRNRETVLSRAAVVNAVTRYAHEVATDEFQGAELEAAAGGLLVGRNGGEPAPLPFIPLPV